MENRRDSNGAIEMKEPIVIIPLSIAKSICDSWKYGVSVDSDDMQVMRKAIEAAESPQAITESEHKK